MQGLRTPTPCSVKNLSIHWLPQKLTANSLLLAGSPTDNMGDEHILYMYDVLYSYNKVN